MNTMIRLFSLSTAFLISFGLFAQDIEGAWKLIERNGEKVTEEEFIKIYQDGYFAFGAKKTDDNAFISAGGGEYEIGGKKYAEVMDFYTVKPEKVGERQAYEVSVKKKKMTLIADMHGKKMKEVWEQISNEKNPLTGNWVFAGRKNEDGEIQTYTPGARRTIKILSGGRFQWAAFNSETKEFMGTGGGTYTAENGKYEEIITFFSRDDSRVGASLQFDFDVKDGKWHHSGKSSKGDPMYEIWGRYQETYLK